MNYQEFAAELRRMAETNGVTFINHDKLLNLLGDDIAHEADFINIVPSFANKGQFFVVTSRSATTVKMGTFGAKVLWTVLLSDITSVEPSQSYFSGYQVDEIRVETRSGRREFRFGFTSPQEARRAQMAEGNTRVAAGELQRALSGGPPETPASSGPEQDEDYLGIIAQHRDFALALSSMTGPDAVGRPFGEGLGLEQATQFMFESFDSPEAMRSASSMLAVSFLTDGIKAGIGPEELDQVMGVGQARQFAASEEQATATESLAGAAMGFLSQFSNDGEPMWELWKKRDDVAGEFLCWHTVAWQRLARAGAPSAELRPLNQLGSGREPFATREPLTRDTRAELSSRPCGARPARTRTRRQPRARGGL
jgi:hypothetical protein